LDAQLFHNTNDPISCSGITAPWLEVATFNHNKH